MSLRINFHPDRGTILICDYGHNSGFQPPEMTKMRPVVIVSPRRRLGQIVSVVPLSSSAPARPEPWHCQLSPGAYPPARVPMWAKCDMVAAVALARLDRVRHDGGFRAFTMPDVDFTRIIEGMKAALGSLEKVQFLHLVIGVPAPSSTVDAGLARPVFGLAGSWPEVSTTNGHRRRDRKIRGPAQSKAGLQHLR